jgi:hypothetical protein
MPHPVALLSAESRAEMTGIVPIGDTRAVRFSEPPGQVPGQADSSLQSRSV